MNRSLNTLEGNQNMNSKRSLQLLSENYLTLRAARGWTNHRQVIAAANGRISNGTLGKISAAQNVLMTHLDELACVFGVQVWQLFWDGLDPTRPPQPQIDPDGLELSLLLQKVSDPTKRRQVHALALQALRMTLDLDDATREAAPSAPASSLMREP
jgi:hypothetical protein